MIGALIVMTGIHFALALILFNKRLTSISIWVSGMLFIASVAYAININYFGSDISSELVLLIEGCILCYFFGETIGRRFNISVDAYGDEGYVFGRRVYKPSKIKIFLLCILIIAITLYKFYDMYEFALTRGHSGLLNLVSFMRPYMNDGTYTNSTLLSIFASYAEASAYVFIFYFLYDLIYDEKKYIRLIFPIVCYFFFLISTTGRTGFIRFFIILLGILYILLKGKSKYNNISVDYKYVKYIFIIGIIMVTVFYLWGSIFRNSSRTIGQYFANYFSAGIYGLNYYLKNGWPRNEAFGEYTFSNIYYYINKIFGTNYEIVAHNLPFFSWGKSRSNIYTAFVLPLQDYGIIGLLFTRTVIGILYTSLESYVLRARYVDRHILVAIVFGYFLYINFSVPIADRFIEFLTVTTFPSLMFFVFIQNKLFGTKLYLEG